MSLRRYICGISTKNHQYICTAPLSGALLRKGRFWPVLLIFMSLSWLACCFLSDARPDQAQLTSQGRCHNYVTALGGSKNAHSNQCKFSYTKSWTQRINSSKFQLWNTFQLSQADEWFKRFVLLLVHKNYIKLLLSFYEGTLYCNNYCFIAQP